MERTPRTILIRVLGIIFFVFIIIFAYGRFERYIYGPEIREISLEKYQTIDTQSLLVTGRTSNTETLRINGRIITQSDEQKFSEMIVLSPGSSIIEIDVEDSFGKVREYQYVVYSTSTEHPYETNYQEAQRLLQEKSDAPPEGGELAEDITTTN